MVKKKKDEWKEVLETVASSTALKYIKDYSENLGRRIHDFALAIEQKIAKMFMVHLLLVLGIVLSFIAFPFLIEQYLDLSFGWSLLIIGLLVIIIAMFSKGRINKQKITF